MRLSADGTARLGSEEGFRSRVYQDSVGVWTIGFGTTRDSNGRSLNRNTRSITEAHARELLARDVRGVERVIDAHVRVPINQCEYDALVSLGYNIGEAGLRDSTVLKRLNKGDRVGAGAAFMMWIIPPSLVGRRRRERLLFRGKSRRNCGGRVRV